MSTKNNDQNNCDVHLHAEIEALKQALVEKQNQLISMETACLRESDRQAELEDSIIAWQDKYDRLYESHKRVQKVNQSLEDKLLKLVDRNSGERAQLTSDVATLSVRLAQANYNIAKLQREIERYKNDINLAIQLLQCKPDSFVPQKVSSLPMDIQSKVSSYMRLETNSHSDSEGSTSGVGVTRSGSYKVLPASDSPPPICPFPPTAMVYSMRGIGKYAQNSECNDNSTEQLISPSIMAKYLEDELKSNEIKHCDTCKCSLKDLTVLADEQKTYNIGTQTILHGDNNSSLCLRCNSNLNSPSRTNSPYIMKLVKSSDSVISETKSSVSDFNDADKLFTPAKKDDLMVNPILGHHRLCDRTTATSQTSTTTYNHNNNNNNNKQQQQKQQQQQPFNSILTSQSYLSTTLPTSITTQATIINDTAKYFNENQHHNLINSNHKQNNDEHDLIDLNKFINNNNTNKNNIKNSIITTNNIHNKSPKMTVNNDIKINSNNNNNNHNNDNNNIIVNDIILNNHNNQLLNDNNHKSTTVSSSSAAATVTTITNTNTNSTIITTTTTTTTVNNNNNNNNNNNASRKSDSNNLLIDTIENSNTSNNIYNNNGIVQGNNIINNKSDNLLLKNNENKIENNNENCLLDTTTITTATAIKNKNNLQQQQQTISATGSTNSLWSKTSSSEGAKLFENFNRNLIKTIKAENPKYRGPRLCALRIQNGSNNILLDGIESELQPVLYTRRQRFLDEELDDTKDIITSKISMVMSTSSSITNLPSSSSLNNEILIGQDLSILETPLSPNKQNLNDIKENHVKNDIKLQQQQQQQNNLISSMMVINTQPSCSVSNFGSIQQQQQQQQNLNMPTLSNELFFHQQQQQHQSLMEISNFDMITLCDNSIISSFKNSNSKSCTQSSSLSSSNCLDVVELQENALLRRQQLNRVAEWVQNNSQMEQQQQQIINSHKILINNNSNNNNNNNSIPISNFSNNLNTNTNTSFDNNIKFSLQNANNNNNNNGNSIEKLSINNECNLNKSKNQQQHQQQISNGIYNAQQMNKKQIIMNYHTIQPTITTTNININNYHNSYLNNDNKIAQNNYIINCNYYDDDDDENNKNSILKIQQQQQQQQQSKQLNGEEKIEKDNWLENEKQQQQQKIDEDNENLDNNQKLNCNNINDKSLNQVDLAQMEYNVKQFLLKQNEWSIRNNKPISSNSSCSNKTPTITATIQKQSNKNQISNNCIDNNNLNINNNSSNNTITNCYPHRTETNL